MGDCTFENSNKKRVRDDSDSVELNPNSPELKRVNTTTITDPNPPESTESNQGEHESEANSPESNGVEPESEFDSPEARMIRDNILDILDDTETVPATQDLDSVIRSFEEEILQASPSAVQPAVVGMTSYPVDPQPALVGLTSDSGQSQPDLGYLLEASDDELGLPPTVASSEAQAHNEPINTSLGNAEILVGLGNMTGFEDDLQSYDTFGLGLGERPIEGGNYAGNSAGDFVTVDGLFDYSEPSDFWDFSWRPESLPAL